MKTLHILFGLLLIAPVLSAQTINTEYDKALADSLGADVYGGAKKIEKEKP